jgi:hypothetical protein
MMGMRKDEDEKRRGVVSVVARLEVRPLKLRIYSEMTRGVSGCGHYRILEWTKDRKY